MRLLLLFDEYAYNKNRDGRTPPAGNGPEGYMAQGRLNPLNDYLFLKVMGEKGDEEQLRAFLNAVLGWKGRNAIESVEIIENKTAAAEVLGDKTSILDAAPGSG
jgi:hypothetical protein